MKITFKSLSTLIGVLYFTTISLFAQLQSPVQVTTLLTPPYSPFFSDLYKVGGKGLIASIVFKDFSEPSWDVKIKIKIESNNGLVMETKNLAALAPITIYPGVPLMLQGDEWAQMLDYNNLNISGADSKVLTTRGVLPEGFYTFCVEVMDARSGKLLSNTSCASGQFILGGIPQVIAPKGNYILPTIPQNIIFQWIMTAPPYDPQNTEYSLRVYEITTEGVDPAAAITSDNALKMYESEFSPNLQFTYDASATNLEIGKRYVYQVKVQDKNGKAMFRNEGLSEPGWFMYGYPVGGKIELENPKDGSQFGPKDQLAFKWGLPDNKAASSQQIGYKFKVVKILASDTTNLDEAYKNKEVVYEEETRPSASNTSWETVIREDLDKDTWFAWKVQAYSGEQMVAESKVQKFKSRPLLEKFLAGDHEVIVLSTQNNDISKLTGKGLVKLDKAGDKTAEVDFKDITLKKLAENVFALDKGELFKEISGMDKIELTPKLKENGIAYFSPNAVRLNKNMLSLRGKMEIPLDIVLDGEAARIVSDNSWIDYNIYKITGGVKVSGKYDLMEPLNFCINLDTNSTLIMGLNGYEMFYYGSIGLPENSQNAEGKRIVLPFVNLTSLKYIELDAELDRMIIPPYRPIPNTNLLVYPKKFVIDFSDKKSPSNFPKDWKGAYIPQFDLVYKQDFDEKKRIRFKEEVTQKIDLATRSDMKNWFQSTGLFFNCKRQLTPADETYFSEFKTNATIFEVMVENGIVKNGIFRGTINIPVIDDSKKFKVYANINNDGFQDGLLESSLEGQLCEFAVDNPDSKASLKIKRAVFSGNNHMDMTVDVSIPKIKINAPNVPGFKAFGDYQIGFGKKNGSTTFGNQVVGNYNGTVELVVDTFGVTYLNNKYLYYASAGLNISDDLRGAGGFPLRTNMFGSKEVSESLAVPNDYQNPPTVKVSAEVISAKPAELKMVDSILVELECPMAYMKGKIGITKNDPVWGTCFKGKINGHIFAPSKIKAGSMIIIGKSPDKTPYWFFEAYVADEGIGVPLIPGLVNIVALEGKVYKNMSVKKSDNKKSIEVVFDKSVKYGGAMYMQIIDQPQMGRILKSDLGVEIKFFDKDFEIAMQAEATILNLNGREGPAAKIVSEAMPMEKVTAAVATEVNKQELKVGDWTFKPNIETDLSGGGLISRNGSTSVEFGANVKKKAGYFNFTNDEWKLKIAGSKVAAAFDIEKLRGSDNFALGLAYFPDSASVKFKMGELVGIRGGFNKTKNTAQFGMNYQDKRFSVMTNLNKKSGSFEFSPNKDFVLASNFSMSDYTGMLKLKASGVNLFMENNKSGQATLMVDDNLKIKFNPEEKYGYLDLKVDGKELSLTGSPNEAAFKFKGPDILFDAGAVRETNKAWVRFEQGSERNYLLDINSETQTGEIKIKEGDKEFGLGASKAEGSAFFNMKMPDLDIATEANLKENTGKFELTKNEDNYLATLDKDSAVFRVNRQDLKMLVAGYKEKRAALGFTNPDMDFYVSGDVEGRGAVRFKNDLFKLAAFADKPNETGRFSFLMNTGDSLNLFLDKIKGNGSFAGKYGDRTLSGYMQKNKGRGGIQMDMPEFKVGLAGDVAGYGKIYFEREQDNILIDMEASRKTLDGHSIFKLGQDSVVSRFDLEQGTAQLNSNVQGTIVNGSFDKEGIATAFFQSGDKQMDAKVEPKGINHMTYTQPNLFLYAEGNKPNVNAKISLKLENDSLRALFDKKNQEANFDATFANYSLGANVQHKEGKGNIYYIDNNRKVTVSGDKAGKGQAVYQDGNYLVDVMVDKPKSNVDILYGNGEDSVYAAVRERKQLLGSVKMQDIRTSFEIEKTGDNRFAFSDQNNKFNIAYLKDKSIFLQSKIKEVTVTAAYTPKGTKDFYFQKGSDSVRAFIEPKGDKIIKYYVNEAVLDFRSLANGDKTTHFVVGDNDFTSLRTSAERLLDYKFANKRIKVDPETLLFNTGKHEVLLKNEPNKKRLFIDGKEVELKLGIPFDLEDITITYLVEGEFHFLRLKAFSMPNIDVGFNELNFPYLNVKLPNFDIKFKGVNFGFDFGFNGFDLKFPELDFFKFNIPGLNLNFRGFDFDFDIEDVVISFPGKFTMDLKWKQDFNFNINLERFKFGFAKHYFSFDIKKNFRFEFPDASRWFQYNFDSEIFGMNFDLFKFDYEPLKLLSFSYDTKLFKIFDTGLEFVFDNKSLLFEIDKHLKFKWDVNKYFNITPINLGAVWGDLDLGLSLDSLRFGFTPVKLNITPFDLNFDYAGKLLTLDLKKNLSFKYDVGKIFTISPLNFKANWGKYAISFGKIDPLTFTDGIKFFKISGDFLALNDLDLDLRYNFGLDLNLKYKMDFCKISLSELSAKFGKYNLGFGLNGVWLDLDKYKFSMKDIISLDIDGNLLSYDLKNPFIGLKVPAFNYSFGGWMDNISFKYDKFNIDLSKLKGLAYWDDLNRFEFGDDLIIKTGIANFSMGIKGLKLPSRKFFMDYDKYSMSWNGLQGIKFALPDGKWFNLGGELNFGIGWGDLNIEFMKDYFKFFKNDFGVVYGGEKVFGVTYKKSEVSLLKDYTFKMDDEGKGVEINEDGVITLVNNDQRIVAGGDQPIRFEDPKNMKMENNDPSEGFKFNVIGMDFAVVPTEDNNVSIETTQKFGKVAIVSQGEGLMQARLTSADGSKKYGMLYKNQYTWGLTVGDMKADTDGPKVEQNVQMSGPSKIGKITSNSTSVIQGILYASYSSKTGVFVIRGQVTGTAPLLCTQNVKLDCKFSKDDFYIKVADKPRDQWAYIQPLCIGLRTEGYVIAKGGNGSFNIAAGAAFGFSESLSTGDISFGFGSVSASAYMYAFIGGEGEIVISDKKVEVPSISIFVEAGAGIKVCGEIAGIDVGCKTLVSVYINGRITMILKETEKSAKGTLTAGVNVFGESFDVSFKTEIKV